MAVSSVGMLTTHRCMLLRSCFEQRGKLRSDGRPSFVDQSFCARRPIWLDRRVPYAQLRLLCAASLERAAYLRGRAGTTSCHLRRGWVRRLAHAWTSCGKDVELFAVRSWRARTRSSFGYCCDDDDCGTRSSGAATQLSRMPKRTVVSGTRALARAACKTCKAM